MRKLSLPAALVVTGALCLATAASALAAYVPTFAGSQNGAKTTLHVTSAKADDSTAKITIYSPSAATLTQAPGATIGTVTASINAKAISPDAVIPLTGSVIVADASKYNTPTDIGCSGAATHAAVWNLSLTAAGQTLNVPVYIDATAGAEAALGATKLQTCLASPDVGAACAATLCAKLLDVNFTVSGVFTASSAPLPTWITLFTPYTAGTAAPNAAGTVTALGIDPKPTVTAAAKAGKGGKVAVAGKVSAGGQPAPGVAVSVFSGAKKIATTKTTPAGTFLATVTLKKGSYSLRVTAAAPESNVTALGACALIPAGAPLPKCVSAMSAPFVASSPVVNLRIK
jgi:hypothetical protein